MQRKLIAAAVVAILSPTAALADPTVYGLFDVTFEAVKNNLSNSPNESPELVTNSSRLGVKGQEDLGDGLQAIYQLEVQTNATGADGTPGTLFNSQRDTYLGLKGGYGTLIAGYADTPYKKSRKKVQMLENDSTFAAINIIGKESLSGANFVKRKSGLQYWSPDFNGFEFKLGYSPSAQDATPTAAGVDVSKEVISGEVSYENDLFFATYGHESQRDARTKLVGGVYTAVANLTDTADRVIGVVKFHDGQVGLTYERLNVAQAVNSTSKVDRDAWSLSGKYKFGNSTIGAFYTVANDTQGTAKSGAHQFTVRYGYNFSKRTELYAAYSNLNNEANGKYAFASKVITSTPAGSTSSALGVGMRHKF